MPAVICATCGHHYTDVDVPQICAVCADERQWVPPSGQRWTTLAELAAAGHASDIREIEPGLLGIGVHPPFAIGQRALLVCTRHGNVLWDPPAFIDEVAIRAVKERGGLTAVAASHPHLYGSIVDWSRIFAAPMLLCEPDVGWLDGPHAAVSVWAGSLCVLPDLTLIQCGGHFPGSAVLHWAAGAGGLGVLLTGDTIFVTPGEDRVSFVGSAPNRLPLCERAVRGVAAAVRPYRFDRIYGGFWEPILRARAKEAVERSSERYVQWLRGEVPTGPRG